MGVAEDGTLVPEESAAVKEANEQNQRFKELVQKLFDLMKDYDIDEGVLALAQVLGTACWAGHDQVSVDRAIDAVLATYRAAKQQQRIVEACNA